MFLEDRTTVQYEGEPEGPEAHSNPHLSLWGPLAFKNKFSIAHAVQTSPEGLEEHSPSFLFNINFSWIKKN